jgi:hypothetical protein
MVADYLFLRYKKIHVCQNITRLKIIQYSFINKLDASSLALYSNINDRCAYRAVVNFVHNIKFSSCRILLVRSL